MDNKIENLISEDMTQQNGNGQDYDWHNKYKPNQVSLVDILKADRQDWDRAAKVIPHEVQTVIDRLLSQFDTNRVISSDFTNALRNPIISEDEQSKGAIKKILKDLDTINKYYDRVIKTLDKLSI